MSFLGTYRYSTLARISTRAAQHVSYFHEVDRKHALVGKIRERRRDLDEVLGKHVINLDRHPRREYVRDARGAALRNRGAFDPPVARNNRTESLMGRQTCDRFEQFWIALPPLWLFYREHSSFDREDHSIGCLTDDTPRQLRRAHELLTR